MARVTVQDCLENMSNRFKLVLAASNRARKLASGNVEPCVPWGSDKSSVVALREVANGHLNEDGSVVEKINDEAETVVSVSSTLDELLEVKNQQDDEDADR